jgi:hypothetical protein
MISIEMISRDTFMDIHMPDFVRGKECGVRKKKTVFTKI